MTAGELCTGEVVIARPEWSVIEAAQRMADYDVGDLVVIDDEDGIETMRPVGILTDRDLVVEVLAKGMKNPEEIPIGSIMTCEMLTADDSEDLTDVLARMQRYSVRRMPVVDQEGTLVGIITYDDIVQWLSEQVARLASLASSAKSPVL